ncbi:MAG TPA: phosphatase PAP2 family protein [Patescibacteria group bacterium]|nr:phosphatase PAP2 family protein [Patescibacteria group bacterium]
MLNSIILFFASIWIWVMYVFLIAIWFRGGRIKREQIFHAFIISFVSWGIAEMVKDILPTSLRPFQVNGFPPLTLTVPFDSAFPSGHSAMAFSLAVAIFLFDKKIGILYLLGALFVSLGRIFGNVHYPIDILGGAVLGTFIALISENIHFEKLLRRK